MRHIEFELPTMVVGMIDLHLAKRSPLLCPASTPWLLPRRDGTAPINEDQLARKIRNRIQREIGLTINIHLFRHLAAMVWLKQYPGAYEAARRLLGHALSSTTINAYAGFEAAPVAQMFAEVIDAARRK